MSSSRLIASQIVQGQHKFFVTHHLPLPTGSMKVKELRLWLADLGERNKQHQMRTQLPFRRRKESIKKGTSERDHHLVVKRKTSSADTSSTFSNDTTSPQSLANGLRGKVFGNTNESRDEAASKEIDFGSNSWDFSLEDGRSLESSSSFSVVTAYDRHDDTKAKSGVTLFDKMDDSALQEAGGEARFSEPSKVSGTRHPDYYKRRFTIGEVEGVGGMGPEHTFLLRNHMATFTHTFAPAGEASTPPKNTTLGSLVRKKQSMTSGNIFEKNILTSGILDDICMGKGGNKISQIMLAGSESSSELSEDDILSLSQSGDFSKISIAPSVLDSKIASLMLDDNPKHFDEMARKEDLVVPRRKKTNPKDLTFLNSKVGSAEEPASSVLVPKEELSSVSLGITRFGGTKKKKNMVQQRQEQLEQLWFEQKAVTHVRKVKWGDCVRPGVYKRKVVIDVEKK